jgi:NADPH:quinone reductase
MARAVRFDRYGGTDVLYIADVDAPRPESDEVVVAVQAAGTNPGEATIREGKLDKLFPATFPAGEGSDFAGVISQVGTGVTEFNPGDEVLGWSARRNSHADYVAVPANQLIRKPAGLSWEVAGALYVVAVTAYAAVRAVGVAPGDTVVVSSAAGGVGSITVQLAKLRGARVVGIASHSNHNWLRSLGITPIAYGEDLLNRVRAATPGGVNAFIDTYGPEYVKLAGKYGAKTEGSSAASTPDVLAEMTELVASGKIVVPIAATYPLQDVAKAYLDLSQGHTRGKIVLIP